MYAAKGGHTHCVQALVEGGADLNEEDEVSARGEGKRKGKTIVSLYLAFTLPLRMGICIYTCTPCM